MSNLCQEITLPTYPISHIDDYLGEIALCILSAVNVGKVKSDEELEDLCDLSVRSLDELIDYQDYPVEAPKSPPRHVVPWALDLLVWHTIWRNLDTSMIPKKHGTLFMDCLSLSNITF